MRQKLSGRQTEQTLIQLLLGTAPWSTKEHSDLIYTVFSGISALIFKVINVPVTILLVNAYYIVPGTYVFTLFSAKVLYLPLIICTFTDSHSLAF